MDADRVRHLLSLGRDELAAQECARLLAARPDDPDVVVLAAAVALAQERDSDAIDFARRAASLAPGNDVPLRVLAEALGRQRRYPEAAHAAYQAVCFGPEDWRNHLSYSQRLAELPDAQDLAWAAGRQAVRLAPDEWQTHAQIAGLAMDEGRRFRSEEHLAIAESALGHALQLDPDNAALMNDLALVQMARADPAAGLGTLGWGMQTDPSGAGPAIRSNIQAAVTNALMRLGWVITLAAFVPLLGLAVPVSVVSAVAAIGYTVLVCRRVQLQGSSAERALVVVVRASRLLQAAVVLAVVGLVGLVVACLPSLSVPAVVIAELSGIGVLALTMLPSAARG